MENVKLDSKLISHVILSNFNAYANFHLMFIQRLEKATNEEEILKLISNYKLILDNLESNVIDSILNETDFHPAIGHFISVSLNLALNKKYFKIKKESIDLLETLMVNLNTNYLKKPCVHNIGDLFASFLPGICQGLMKIIINDEKQNRVVYITALRTLSILITIVFYKYETGISFKDKTKPFLTVRSEEWKVKNMEKINIVLEKIERVLLNHSLHIKEALINFASTFFFHLVKDKDNYSILPLVTKNLFRIQLILLHDENERIQKLADAFIQKVSKYFINNNNLSDIINEDFFTFMDDFKQEVNVYNEEEILNKVKLLCGYIRCLDKVGLKIFFLVENHKNMLFDLLKIVSELNLNRMNGNVILKEFTEFSNIEWFEKKHKFFENQIIQKHIELCCYFVKKYVEDDFILDCLVDFMNKDQKASNRVTTIYVLNFFLKNLDQQANNVLFVNELVILLYKELNDLVLNDEYEDNRFESIIYCSLLLESITIFAYSIPILNHKIYFLNILYLIMALTGCPYLPIQINAKVSLLKLTQIYKYNTIENLINLNINYILSQIHIKLKNYDDKENLYMVFKLIYEVSKPEIVNYFDQTFDMLIQTLDSFYSSSNLIRLVKILSLTVKTFKKWNLILLEKIEDQEEQNLSEIDIFEKELVDFMKEQTKKREQLKLEIEYLTKPINEEMVLEEQNKLKQLEIDQPEVEKNNEDLPVYLKYTKMILEKTSNFLSDRSIEVRLLVLDIMVDGLEILKHHEDLLLPTAHVIWDSLILRFKDEPSVLFKCIYCLEILAVTCKDFIRSRTIKQALPQIYNFLKLNWKKSLVKSNPNIDHCKFSKDLVLGKMEKRRENISNAHFYSMNYRLQCLLLGVLGRIANNLNLCRQDLWPMINILVVYSKDCQPVELSTLAKSSLTMLEKKDFFAVYYYTNYQDTF